MKILIPTLLSLALVGCSASDETLTDAMESIATECRSPVVIQIEASTFNKTLLIRCDDMSLKKKESK